LCALAAGLLLIGCPSRFNPRAEPKLESPNAAAERAFSSARQSFDGGRYEIARGEFDRFTRDFPQDPLAPFARVFAGRAALSLGDARGAARALETAAQGPPDQASTEQARFYLGLARARLGDCAAARSLLDPFGPKITPGEEAMTLHAQLAACGQKTGD